MQRLDQDREDITADDESLQTECTSSPDNEFIPIEEKEIWSAKKNRTLEKLAVDLKTTVNELKVLLDRNAAGAVESRKELYEYFNVDVRRYLEHRYETPFCELLLNCSAQDITDKIRKFDDIDSTKFGSENKMSGVTINYYCVKKLRTSFARIVLENQNIQEFLYEWVKNIRREKQSVKWINLFSYLIQTRKTNNFLSEFFAPHEMMEKIPVSKLKELAAKNSKKFSELTKQEKENLKSEVSLIIKSNPTIHSTPEKSHITETKNAALVTPEEVSFLKESSHIHAADIVILTKLINKWLPASEKLSFHQIQENLENCVSGSDFYQRLNSKYNIEKNVCYTSITKCFSSLKSCFLELAVNKKRVDILTDLKKAIFPNIEETLKILGQPYLRISPVTVAKYITNELKTSFYQIFLGSRNISTFLKDIRKELKSNNDIYVYIKNTKLLANPTFIQFFDKYFGCSSEELEARLIKMSNEDFERISKTYESHAFESLTPDQFVTFKAAFAQSGNKRNQKDIIDGGNIVPPLKKYAAASPLMFTEAIPAAAEPDRMITFNPGGGDWQD